MNTLRTKFILPNSQKILITPYWFIGFIEGEGVPLPILCSVSTSKSFPLRFNIVLIVINK